MTKQLQQDSKFNQFDTDGDGVVTDEELSRSERMLQIENNDKMQDQQRLMAWVAMWSTIVAVGALLSPFIAIDRMNSAAAFLNTFLVAQTGIVVGLWELLRGRNARRMKNEFISITRRSCCRAARQGNPR
jgi:hypothetical protein